ncbi:MAG: fibrobacter succinogenes major paralogous domain-containing protein [Bacteroidetes bacterium]|nr:fibrobacter succinogenes major paralogous domain-containing protein [Bacteroidota bacterium]
MKKYFLNFCLLFALITFFNSCGKEDSKKAMTTDSGVVINGVKWATRNVDAPGTFAKTPENAGMLYQWNRNIGWSAADPRVNSNGATVWDVTVPSGTKWEKVNDPSPAGWRVPTSSEIYSLCNREKVNVEWTTEKGITGMRFTDIVSGNSMFLPAINHRNNSDGTLSYCLGYWSSTKNRSGSSPTAYHLFFYDNTYVGDFVIVDDFPLRAGLPLRSVAE